MNKKFLGIKLSVYLTLFICLVASFLVWLVAGANIDVDTIGNLLTGYTK